jgi:zinc transporter, ZIP family
MIGAATEPTALTVFAAALLTALATGLGAMPLAFTKRASGSWLGVGNSIAASLMLGASVMLFYEGALSDPRKMLLGASVGLAAIAFAARWLNRRENLRFEALRGVQARTAVVIVAVMTVHSMAEGIGVGVAFGPGRSFGLLTALAIAVHNIPEGLAISLVLVPRGVSVPRAAGWSVVTSLPQPVLAVPAFVFVEAFRGALPVGLGFAGGAMIWMVLARLLPDVFRSFSGRGETKNVGLT